MCVHGQNQKKDAKKMARVKRRKGKGRAPAHDTLALRHVYTHARKHSGSQSPFVSALIETDGGGIATTRMTKFSKD